MHITRKSFWALQVSFTITLFVLYGVRYLNDIGYLEQYNAISLYIIVFILLKYVFLYYYRKALLIEYLLFLGIFFVLTQKFSLMPQSEATLWVFYLLISDGIAFIVDKKMIEFKHILLSLIKWANENHENTKQKNK